MQVESGVRWVALWMVVATACGGPRTAPQSAETAGPKPSASGKQPAAQPSTAPLASNSPAPPKLAAPPATATVRPAKQAPKVLAPLGPYPTLDQAPPANCPAPRVRAAAAPLKMLERSDWYWPWVVQAILAHDHAFQRVSSLDDRDSTSRAVRLQERTIAAKSGKSSLVLDVDCRTVETCLDVVRVLRAVVPASSAALSCAPPDGEPTARSAALEKSALLPSADDTRPITDPGSACARLSTCLRHQSEKIDAKLGLKCQAAPRSFPIRCAAQYTCYDVAECANAKTGPAPIFSPFDDLFGQVAERGARIGRGLAVADPMGGGGLDPSVVSSCYLYDGESDQGAWASLLLSFSVGSRDPQEGYYTDGSGSWSPAFIEPNGVTRLGPPQSVAATFYNAVGVPGGTNGPDSFDYDGDGKAELLLPVYSVEHANSGTLAFGIWSRKGDSVVQYPGTGSLPIVGFADVDNDGRPDLMLDYDGTLDATGTHSSRRSDVWSVAHSLKNGSFSTTDAVAKAHQP